MNTQTDTHILMMSDPLSLSLSLCVWINTVSYPFIVIMNNHLNHLLSPSLSLSLSSLPLSISLEPLILTETTLP